MVITAGSVAGDGPWVTAGEGDVGLAVTAGEGEVGVALGAGEGDAGAVLRAPAVSLAAGTDALGRAIAGVQAATRIASTPRATGLGVIM